jgi:hypothetical protein
MYASARLPQAMSRFLTGRTYTLLSPQSLSEKITPLGFLKHDQKRLFPLSLLIHHPIQTTKIYKQ